MTITNINEVTEELRREIWEALLAGFKAYEIQDLLNVSHKIITAERKHLQMGKWSPTSPTATGLTEVRYPCNLCGRPMEVKYGRYGQFIACSGWPDCNNTKPYVRGKSRKVETNVTPKISLRDLSNAPPSQLSQGQKILTGGLEVALPPPKPAAKNAGNGLMSVAEVLKWTGLGRTKVAELTKDGTLPSILIGRRRLYPSDALVAATRPKPVLTGIQQPVLNGVVKIAIADMPRRKRPQTKPNQEEWLAVKKLKPNEAIKFPCRWLHRNHIGHKGRGCSAYTGIARIFKAGNWQGTWVCEDKVIYVGRLA